MENKQKHTLHSSFYSYVQPLLFIYCTGCRVITRVVAEVHIYLGTTYFCRASSSSLSLAGLEMKQAALAAIAEDRISSPISAVTMMMGRVDRKGLFLHILDIEIINRVK